MSNSVVPLNFFQVAPTHRILADCLATVPRRGVFPQSGSRWRELAQRKAVAALVRHEVEVATRELADPWPILPEDYYLDAKRSGERARFEKIYFDRRIRFGRFALLALLDPEDPRWLDAMLLGFSRLLEEDSWALPAHIANPSGKDPKQIDLFSGETAVTLADFCQIFGPAIPESLRSRLVERLKTGFWENYLDAAAAPETYQKHFYWIKIESNWNAVCHHGVLGSALSLCEDADFLARLLVGSRDYLRRFLAGFTRDGGCEEGPTYWAYGFGHFTWLNQRLEARTGGQWSLFEGDEHIWRIAQFGGPFWVEDWKLLNVADSPPEQAPDAAIFAALGRRLHLPELETLGNYFYAVNRTRASDFVLPRHEFFGLGRQLVESPEDSVEVVEIEQTSCEFPDLGMWFSRGTDVHNCRWVLSVKGGHNSEHHNHNDVGSLMLFLNGTAFLAEIGAPAYNGQFFSEDRYRFLAARSFGHSVPLIAGIEQRPGREAAGRILSATFGGAQDTFSVDISAAYPPEANLVRAVRTVVVDRREFSFSVEDEIVGRGPDFWAESAFISRLPPVRCGAGVELISGEWTLHIEPQPGTLSRGSAELEYRDHRHQPAFIHRLVYEPAARGAHSRVSLRFTVTPASRT